MEITVQVPESSVLNADKMKKLDKLCAVFPPDELLAFYQKHQLEMMLTTSEDVERSKAVEEMLQTLCGQS